ncbi:alpha/beta hydrolase [Lactiplantibacillus daowaiensis]|uniref:Alpha/beta hydrolase n=1 Tax=Lactiplantibacillus daowaiensis TaxID=2559918 RepID=A0ABW1S0N9_9LACO|nr:alpha/beta hydrolase [Lactiplantibacillus daowaiensis]
MKSTTKQGLITTGWFAILLAVIGGTMLWQRQVRHPRQKVSAVTVTSTDRIPTVLLLGNQTSTSHGRQLVAGLQQNNGAQSIVKAQISRQGTVTFIGRFQPHDNRPYLKIMLPTGRATAKQQAQWVRAILRQAQQQLAFKKFNLISYDDGGIVATRYLSRTTAALTPQNFVAIATPFNGTSSRLNTEKTTAVTTQRQTTVLKQLIAERHQINRHMRVLLIAGHAKSATKGDGVVPIQSALAGQAVFSTQVTHYQQRVLHTWRASHDQLFNSWRLVNLIQNFIN